MSILCPRLAILARRLYWLRDHGSHRQLVFQRDRSVFRGGPSGPAATEVGFFRRIHGDDLRQTLVTIGISIVAVDMMLAFWVWCHLPD